jgi:hypothetical protein
LKAPDRQTIPSLACLGVLCFLLVPASLAQDMQHPASGYLEAKLRIGVDAGHTKVGEKFQAEALSSWSIADCTLPQGARIYGKVVSATRHSKSSPESTLGLLIEGADCQGHPDSPLALHILEITGSDSSRVPLHAVLPVGSAGMSSLPMAHDDNTADEETSSVRVGAVLGENHMKLEIAAGPGFADMLHSDKQNVSLLTGTRLVLGTPGMIPADQQLHLHPGVQQP